MKRILVVGGAGFIGGYITQYFLSLGYEVAIIDKDIQNFKTENPKLTVYIGDILNTEFLDNVFREFQPDVVSHHAALISTVQSIQNPCADATTNVIGSINVYQACLNHNVKRFIFASSGGAIYGEADGVRESDSPEPMTPYGLSKLTAENYIEMMYTYNPTKTLPFFFRYANVYGPGQKVTNEGGVISIFMEKIINNEPITIYGRESEGDGGCIRDYVYVDDIAKLHRFVIEHPNAQTLPSIINVSTGTGTSTLELVELIESVSNIKANIQFKPPRNGDPKKSILDNWLLRVEFKTKPTKLSEGLKKLYLSKQ